MSWTDCSKRVEFVVLGLVLEVDLTFYALRALQMVGVVRETRAFGIVPAEGG